MNESELSGRVIGCAMSVHTAQGPGLLENVYKECLCYKLKKEGFAVENRLGLLINFNVKSLKDGIRRVIHDV